MIRLCRDFNAIVLLGIVILGSQAADAASAHWQTNFNRAKKQSLAESKPLIAMFTASWCGPCRKMKSTTLVDRTIRQHLKRDFITVMVDTDRNPGLTRQYNITAMPTFVVIDPVTGKTARVRGYQGRGQFLSFLHANRGGLQLASGVSPESKPAPQTVEQEKGLLTPYCLVNIVEKGELVKADSSFSVKKEGYTVTFASAEDKETFLKNPDKYWPQFNGACPVMLAKMQKTVLGEARWSVEYDGKLFFCHSKEHALEFIDSPEKFSSQQVAAQHQTYPRR